jgi:hypothetical protein
MKLIIDVPEDKNYTQYFRCMSQELDRTLNEGIPLDHVFNTIKDGIKEEADYAYADFEQYKADVLNAEADELPNDDFRYGMERAIEIINAYRKAVNE